MMADVRFVGATRVYPEVLLFHPVTGERLG